MMQYNTVTSGNSVSRNSGISHYSGYVQLTKDPDRGFGGIKGSLQLTNCLF